MKIGIIGGGFMGLVLGYKLSKMGVEVKVFERDEQLGGLSTFHDYEDFIWDRFYHVILPSDRNLIRFVREIGLGESLHWKHSYTGYYVHNTFYSISNVKEFLLFPPLNLIDKLKLGYTIFYGSKINNWRKLEKITAKEWLIKLGGIRTFEKFWKPLLLAKLGENYDKVSAVFIWTYIKRLFKAREYPAKKEQVGYVAGGYKTVFDRLENLLSTNGSQVLLNAKVEDIRPASNNGIELCYNNQVEHFDKVIFTGPLNILEKVTSPSLFKIEGNQQQIAYLGAICLVLITKKALVPFYVLNLADEKIPFTGVIGMSSIVDLEQTAGMHLTYFPKYITADHPYWSMSDEELKEIYMKGVKDLFPDLATEEIISVHINRAFKVQPLQVLNYSEIIPKIHTLHPDFYVLNTSQFVSDSVNNNTVVNHVSSFMDRFSKELQVNRTIETVMG